MTRLHTMQIALYNVLPKWLQLRIRRTLFPTYLVAAKVLVTNNEGQILAVKTTYGHPGWDLPSGHLDKGESPDQAAARELYEETGIVADNLKQAAVIFQPRTGYVQTLFTGTVVDDVPFKADGVEVSDVRWVDRDEVNFHPYAQEALDTILLHKVGYWVSELGH